MFLLVTKLCLVTPVLQALLVVHNARKAELCEQAFPSRTWERANIKDAASWQSRKTNEQKGIFAHFQTLEVVEILDSDNF